MRKMVFGRKLSRGRKAREALFRSLIKALIISGKINTTKAKAKAIQADIDKLITLAKKGTLSAERRVSAILGNNRALAQIVTQKISKAFASRTSGFTKITLLSRRKGDAAEMARIEWVEKISLEEKKPAVKGKEETKAQPKKAKKTVKKAK